MTNNAINTDLVIPINRGGTGVNTIPVHQIVVGNSTSSVSSIAPSATVGNPLTSAGVGSDPVFTTTISLTDGTVNNVPLNPSDIVNKAYADLLAASFAFKQSCYAGTTVDLGATYVNGAAGIGATLTNAGAQAAFSVDGVTPVLNSRILVKDQANLEENGIYTITDAGSGATNWVLTRATDYDTPTEIQAGTITGVIFGTVNSASFWVEIDVVVTIGTDPIQFIIFGFNTAQFLLSANNLSDVSSASTSRTNLGITNVATQNVTQFDTLVGGAANSITSITTGAAGDMFVSKGAGANPAYITPTAGTALTLIANGTTFSYGLASPLPIANGGTGVVTIPNGILSGNGTSPITGSVVNTGGVVVGNGTSGVVTTAVGTTGTILQGNTAASPTYSTATYPSTTTINQILYSSANNTVVGLATASNGLVVTNPTGVPSVLVGTGTTGNALLSNAAAAPSFSTTTYPVTSTQGDLIYASSNNVITTLGKSALSTRYLSNQGAANAPSWNQVDLTTGVVGTLPVANGGTNNTTFTAYTVICAGTTPTGAFQNVASVGTVGQFLTSSGPGVLPTWSSAAVAGLPWSDTSGVFTMVVNNAYFINAASTVTLPAAPALGDTIEVVASSGALITIQAAGGQRVRIGAAVSAANGTAASNTLGNSITLVYRATGNLWNATSTMGTWTLT